MEYEDNPTRSIHTDVNGSHQQVLREEAVDDEFEMEQLLGDVDSVNTTLLSLYPDMEIDPNMVFEQLEVVKQNPDRVFRVVSLLSQLHRTFINNKQQQGVVKTENDEPPAITAAGPEREVWVDLMKTVDDQVVRNAETEGVVQHPVVTISDDSPDNDDVYGGLVHDVDLIMDVFPDVDPQEVYAYLEARRDEPQRVENVIEELIHRRPVEKSPVIVNAPPAKPNVPLVMDEERKRMGDIGDANVQNPNKKLRIGGNMEIEPSLHDAENPPAVVVDHADDMETTAIIPPSVEPSTSTAIHAGESSSSGQEEDPETKKHLLFQLQVLKDTFPDADRDYLSELINSCGTDEAKLQSTVSDMLEKRDYPKLKDQLERERKQALKKEYSSRIFTPEEVLQWFEDPIAFFGDNSTPVSKNYELHAYAQLHNEFPKLILSDIKKALITNNQHYTGAFHELKERLQEECITIRFKRRKARLTMQLPIEPDELFYKELAFTRIEDKLKDYLKTKEMQRTKRMEEAKANHELLTCACCFDDENLPEELIDCGFGHLFCRECVRRGAEVAIGDGKNGLECMSENCDVKFKLPDLQLVLKPSMISNLLKRIQAEEISSAGIPDLVQCPHCSFAAIMPNQDDKVFRCLNQECLKETCRYCKEPNHIPLRCDEVEKSDEVRMRTYIENKMTDALVRQCYRCSRRFMKEEGCNKMTCVCGASMCYVCREPIKDYHHFQKGGCPQMSDTAKLHHEEVVQGAEKAKKEFVEQHPELKDTQLKHDPTKDLLNAPREPDLSNEVFEGDDDDDFDDGDDSDTVDSDDSNAYFDMDRGYGGDYAETSLDSSFTSGDSNDENPDAGILQLLNNSAKQLMQGFESSFESLSPPTLDGYPQQPLPESDTGLEEIHERAAGLNFIESDMDDSIDPDNSVDPVNSNDESHYHQYEFNPPSSDSDDVYEMGSDMRCDMSRYSGMDSDSDHSPDDESDQSGLNHDTKNSYVDPHSSDSSSGPSVVCELLSANSVNSSAGNSVNSSAGFFAMNTDDSDEDNSDQSDMDDNYCLDFVDAESSADFSYRSGRYSISPSISENSSNSMRSMSDVDINEDLANEIVSDFETCDNASPSSGRGTNESPPLLHSEYGNGSSDSSVSQPNVACDEFHSCTESSPASPRSMTSEDDLENYSFSGSDYSDT